MTFQISSMLLGGTRIIMCNLSLCSRGCISRTPFCDIQAFLKLVRSEACVTDEVMAEDSTKIREMWHLREHISVALSRKGEAKFKSDPLHRHDARDLELAMTAHCSSSLHQSCARAGPVYKYDLSLPLRDIPRLVEATRARMEGCEGAEVVSYGHLGDGNVHLNISVPAYSTAARARIEPFVYEFTADHRGSISAEHGEASLVTAHVPHGCQCSRRLTDKASRGHSSHSLQAVSSGQSRSLMSQRLSPQHA